MDAMACTTGRAHDALTERLRREPYRFQITQAVSLLERSAPPGRRPVGGGEGPSREAVRFRARLSLSAPTAPLESAGPDPDHPGRTVLTAHFTSLAGTSGVLPYPYTEYVLSQNRDGNPALADFLDLFNHRAFSLFYRACKKYRPLLEVKADGEASLASLLLPLMGRRTESQAERHGEETGSTDQVLLAYAGLFVRPQRPAVMLEGLLREASGWPVRVEPFAGRWLALAPADRSRLGGRGDAHALGGGLMLGRRSWDDQGMIRLRVGPLSLEEFRALQPGGGEVAALVALAALYTDNAVDVEVRLVLAAADVPRTRLSRHPGLASRLRRDAWLRTRTPARDTEDLTFRVSP
jgi:type VI secretion system protein ImpH